MTTSALQTHPIDLSASGDLRRSRLTVFFRLLIVIPHLIWMWLWGIVAELALAVAWVVAVFAGRVPDGLHNFLAAYLRYYTRVAAYLLLLADPFPPFGGGK